jgi:hypothetical protein
MSTSIRTLHAGLVALALPGAVTGLDRPGAAHCRDYGDACARFPGLEALTDQIACI